MIVDCAVPPVRPMAPKLVCGDAVLVATNDTAPVGVPLVEVTTDVNVMAVPCAKLADDAASEVMVVAKDTLFQLVNNAFISMEPSPVARS